MWIFIRGYHFLIYLLLDFIFTHTIYLGSILLNYVGSKGKDEKYLQGAVAISPAWNFHSTTPNFSYWSKYVLVNALKFYLWKNKNYFLSFPDNKLDVPALFKTQSVREFDYYAIELGGDHPSVDDYYYHSSPVHKSKNIFVPTLSINSINDPVCSIDGLPKLSDIGDGLCTVTVRKGGHVTLPVINQASGSFLQYLCCISQSYGDELAIKWFDGILKNKSEVV
jgi:predicted alpha/beta-fold hydrolase